MYLIKCKFRYSEYIYSETRRMMDSLGPTTGNVSVRKVWISFSALPFKKKKFDDSSRLDVAEIARVLDMLPSLFLPSRSKDLSAPRYQVFLTI